MSARTIRRRVADGSLPAYRLGDAPSSRVRLRVDELMDKWIVPWIGDVALRDLGEDRVQDWRGAIRGAGCSAGQANAALGILSTALSAARRARRVPANPCQGIRRLKVDVARPRALTPLEVERIRAHLPRPRDAVLVSRLAYAGLRPEEALPLRWCDVGRTIVVSRTFTHGELRERTKTRRVRAVEIVDVLATDLEALRPRVAAPDDLVFPPPPPGPRVSRRCPTTCGTRSSRS